MACLLNDPRTVPWKTTFLDLWFKLIWSSWNCYEHIILYALFVFQQMCIKELRERVENGGDLTKLHEPPVVREDGQNNEQGKLLLSFSFVWISGTLGGLIHAIWVKQKCKYFNTTVGMQ